MHLPPFCYRRNCKHYIGAKDFTEIAEEDQRLICKAFPDGIPEEIIYGDNLHLIPINGQENKIVFEIQGGNE